MAKKAAKKQTSAAKKAAPKLKTEKTAKKVVKPTVTKVEKAVAVSVVVAESVPVTKKTKAERAAASEDEARWLELYEKHKTEKPQSYDMRLVFEAGKALQHKVLGWGWILSNENNRLEVLFKDGKRILISNYNPS